MVTLEKYVEKCDRYEINVSKAETTIQVENGAILRVSGWRS